jgi:hypothetical protein
VSVKNTTNIVVFLTDTLCALVYLSAKYSFKGKHYYYNYTSSISVVVVVVVLVFVGGGDAVFVVISQGLVLMCS